MRPKDETDQNMGLAEAMHEKGHDQGEQQGGSKMLTVCVHCKKEIRNGERRYFSRQAGMKGLYHWECFVLACRQANKAGAQEIETIAVSSGMYDNRNSYDVVNE